jgi:antibiotic biosynthesis monooxygenase (ABM) superfamily enzyme
MATMEERMQILKMIENGHISAEEGAQLLSALEEASTKEESEERGGRAKWFRVRVTDKKTGRNKVNVNIPMGLVNVGMRIGAKFAPEMEDFDFSEVMDAIKTGTRGKIIEVEDDEDGERVEIYVE